MTKPQIVPGAEDYVVDFPHSAFRACLPYFIAAFKGEMPPLKDCAIAWYRPTYVGSGHDGGAKCPLIRQGKHANVL